MVFKWNEIHFSLSKRHRYYLVSHLSGLEFDNQVCFAIICCSINLPRQSVVNQKDNLKGCVMTRLPTTVIVLAIFVASNKGVKAIKVSESN